jgi:hypothetical protein
MEAEGSLLCSEEPATGPYICKGKVVSLRSIESHLGERRYSSYSFLTSALEGGEWSASRPDRALPPGKELPVPIVQEAGWAPEPVWTQRLEERSSAFVTDRTPAVQSVVRQYTDWATRLTVPILSHMNLVHILPQYFPKIYFNIILPSTPRFSEWSLTFKFSNENRPSYLIGLSVNRLC